MSRSAWVACCTREVTVVRPSRSVKVVVTTASPSGTASNTSVLTSRSPGTTSRYTPRNATSKPPFAVIT